MIALNLTVRRHTTYGFTLNEISLGRANTHGVILDLNPPHKGLVRGGLEQRPRGGTYSMDSVVYAVARQLYNIADLLLPKNLVGDRHERCELESTPRILMILYAKVAAPRSR
jgi:hypothetical protein